MDTMHEQFMLENQFDTQPEYHHDFDSSDNVIFTPKTLVVKQRVTMGEKEFDVQYGQKVKLKNIVQAMSATYNVGLDDFLISVSDVGVARTIKLLKPSIAGMGKLYVIKDASGSAASTTITISPFSTETIDGDTSTALNTNFQVKRLYCDGKNWFSL